MDATDRADAPALKSGPSAESCDGSVPALPTAPGRPLSARLSEIAHADWFSRVVIGAIVLSGILSGLETYPAFRGDGSFATPVDLLQHAALAVFVLEMAVKIGAFGSRPWRFFRSGWNVFDFAVVAVSLIFSDTEYVVVFRLARVLRLFTALPGLQVLLSALLKGIPSLGYVGLLLLLHFYIYSVVGTFAFGDNDPIRFGSLHRSMLTLFQVLTLEGWNDILATEYLGSEVAYDDSWKQLPAAAARVPIARPVLAALYFVSFILIGTMIVLNLVTGVIIASLEEANVAVAEENRKARVKAVVEPAEEIRQLSEQLDALAKRLRVLQIGREG